jgi:hypothetical protein
MRTLSPRLNLGKLILALALLSAIIALANTLLASYRVQRDQLVGNTLEANRVYATKLAETTQNFLPSRNWPTPPRGSARATSTRHRPRTKPAACSCRPTASTLRWWWMPTAW